MRDFLSPQRTARARRRLLAGLLLGNLLIAALLMALGALALQTTHEAFRQRAQIATENLAEGLQRTLAVELSQVDMVLQTLAQALRPAQQGRPWSPTDLQTLMAQQRALVPHIESLRLADMQGRALAGTEGPAAAPATPCDRERDEGLRRSPSAGPWLSEPLLDARSGHWVIALARPWLGSDGQFAGVVCATLPLDHFRALFAELDLGSQGAVTLRSDTMRLLARHTSRGDSSGEPGSSATSAELRRALQTNPAEGSFVARTALDGVERSNAYRRVQGFPLLVLVGVGTDDYLAPWRTQRLEIAGLVGLVVLLVDGSSWLLYAAWGRESRSARRLLAESWRTQALLRTASDGIHVLDRSGHVVELSDSFAAMLGRGREALLGQHVSSWDAKLEPEAMAQWLRSFAAGAAHRFETRHRRQDGSLIDVEVHCVVAQIEERELIYCSARDITERKRLEQQLQEALRAQQAMLDNDLIGIVKARELVMVWKNQAMDRLFGYPPDELLGRSLRQLYPDEAGYRAFVEEAGPALRAGGRYRAQLQTLRKDGRPIWIDVNGVQLSAERQETLWLLADITRIKESQQRAEHIAFHDALTGLPNRRLLADRLQQALALAERQGGRLALCYLDLDGFKQINDDLGHAAGDALLQEIARRLLACMRGNDTASRLGGDEFVLLLGTRDEAGELEAALERICAELGKPILLEGGRKVSVSASIGVALYPEDGGQAELLLGRADRAMYQAKKQAQRRICFYAGLGAPA